MTLELQTINLTSMTTKSVYPNVIRVFFNERFALSKTITLSLLLSFSISMSAQTIDKKTHLNFDEFKTAWMVKNQIKTITEEQHEELKNVWIAKNSILEPFNAEKYQALKQWQKKDLPQGFPVMESTGDESYDQAIYNSKKQIWIDNNPKKYEQLFSAKSKMTQSQIEERNSTLNKK